METEVSDVVSSKIKNNYIPAINCLPCAQLQLNNITTVQVCDATKML